MECSQTLAEEQLRHVREGFSEEEPTLQRRAWVRIDQNSQFSKLSSHKVCELVLMPFGSKGPASASHQYNLDHGTVCEIRTASGQADVSWLELPRRKAVILMGNASLKRR